MARRKICVDCLAEGVRTNRPAPYQGPRCHTHHRLRRKETRTRSHDKYLGATYNITREQYQELYLYQGGVCYICQRAKGYRKNLSVDHDHACCPGRVSCGRCVRALLCRPCNSLLGHIRDSVEALERAIEVLTDPPASRMDWFDDRSL